MIDAGVQVPVGALLPWLKSFTGTPQTLPSNFVECNGQTLNDSGSPFNGQVIPQLNDNNRFLRGNTTSGGTGGNDSHGHTLTSTGATTAQSGVGVAIPDGTDIVNHHPPYYNVVWIMRVK